MHKAENFGKRQNWLLRLVQINKKHYLCSPKETRGAIVFPPLYQTITLKTMRTKEELADLSLLGQKHTYVFDYDPEVLETFENKHPQNEYLVTLVCPEFTSLCPKTGQPDFGKIIISYIPREKMVESKSLKLYLFSFRNHGDFHEDCINIIMKDLVKLMDPKYIEVRGDFMPRGGISIVPFANYADEEHQQLRESRLAAQLNSVLS